MIAARGLRRFGRGLVLTGVAVLLQLGGVACGGSDSDDAISGSKLPTISGSELKELPPIAVVAGDPGHAGSAHAGNVYLTSGHRNTLTLLKSWSTTLEDGEEYGVFNARWSPDRRRLGVSLGSWNGDPYSQVAVITLADRAMRRLTEPRGDFVISWSADGRRLLYEDLFGNREGIWSIPVAPGAVRGVRIHLDATRRLVERDGRSFRLSPDGSSIAAEVEGGLLVLDLASGAVRQLTRGDDDFASWSPDSRSILFTRSRPTESDDYAIESDVYAIDADGTDLRQLTSDGASEAMDWSPDGAYVLFLREGLWVMEADGGRQTRLPFNRPQLAVVAADWSPS